MIVARCIFRLTCVLMLVLGMVRTASALPANLAHGRVLEDIRCERDTTQTYALYIPTTLDYTRPSAALVCFDPEGRGIVAVERFAAAAEKLGYVVMGANHVGRGGWATNGAAVESLLRDLNRRFAIDRQRTYAAGFSASAPLAVELGRRGLARGVVVVSASFSDSAMLELDGLPVFATAGVMDFNYAGLRRATRELEQRELPHRVVYHFGGHEWLPAEQAQDALSWLNLQAVRGGALSPDVCWIENEFQTRLAAAPAQPADEHFEALRALARDFKGLADTAAIEQQIVELAAAPEVREAAKAALTGERREDAQVVALRGAVRDGFVIGVKKLTAELRTHAAADTPSPQRARAARVLEKVFVECAELAREALRETDYARAASWLEMMTLLRPDRAQPYYELARCEALRGNDRAALATLQRAAAAGFRDVERMESEAAFSPLRPEPAFLETVSAVRANGSERTGGG